MENALSAADIQHLILQLFYALPAKRLNAFIYQVNDDRQLDGDAREYLFLCISFIKETQNHPEYCNSLESVCKTILSRQRSVEISEVRQKDYLEAMGTNRTQWGRIRQSKSRLQPGQIRELCGGFVRKSDSVFWVNQLLWLSGGALDRDTEPAMERQSLCYIWERLDESERAELSQRLPVHETAQLDGLTLPEQAAKPDRLGPPPHRLYKVLRHLAQESGITIQRLVEEELMTTMNSWYAWKTGWERAEAEGFLYLPHPRLQRAYILLISVIFQLEYYDALRLLQLAGYRMGHNKEDEPVIRYLAEREGDPAAVKRVLLSQVTKAR